MLHSGDAQPQCSGPVSSSRDLEAVHHAHLQPRPGEHDPVTEAVQVPDHPPPPVLETEAGARCPLIEDQNPLLLLLVIIQTLQTLAAIKFTYDML